MRVTAARLASIEDRAAAILAASGTTLLVGAEAELTLEAVTAGLGGPTFEWLNVVTSPYGRQFGSLLRARGSRVHELTPPSDRPVRAAEVAAALERHPGVQALALVHAESLTGVLNPLAEVLELAADRDLVTVVDAVASAGAEPLEVDTLGIDVCVVGPQKGWDGPAGVSIVTVSDRAWSAIEHNPNAVRGSILSLLDIRDQWVLGGRRRVRGTPPPLEIAAIEDALARLAAEGIERVTARHQRVATATRAGVRGLGLTLWIADERDACSVATVVKMPAGISSEMVVDIAESTYGVMLTPGSGELAGVALRIDHMGSNASFPYVSSAVAAVGAALGELGFAADVAAAQRSLVTAFSGCRLAKQPTRFLDIGPKTVQSQPDRLGEVG